MTRFLNGPAEKQTLMLQRAPLFLRVTRDGDKWDALDQIEDTPRRGEQLFTYRRTGQAGFCHIQTAGKNGRRGGGFYAMAEYSFTEVQPSDEIMRDAAKWQQWTREQVKK